jgi:hypothetical protein
MFPPHLLLEYVTLFEAGVLRLVSTEFRDAVAAVPWTSDYPVKRLKLWRACFPRAVSLFYVGKKPAYLPRHLRFVRLDSVSLSTRLFERNKLEKVSLHGCRNIGYVLPYLSSLKTLDLSYAKFPGKALSHLTAVETLALRNCAWLTDDDLAPLTTLTTLDVSNTFYVDAVFPNLPNLRHLRLDGSTTLLTTLPRLTLETLCACHMVYKLHDLPWGLKKVCLRNTCGPDDALRPLVGVQEVDLSQTDYDRLAPLQGVRRLICCDGASLRGLRDLRGDIDYLDISETAPHPPSTFGFDRIGTLILLNCHWVDVDTFKYVQCVDELEMSCVKQCAFTIRTVCKQLRVKRVTTCVCSEHKFKFEGGPVVKTLDCYF